MNQPETTNKLEDLPNIGGTLAELLHKTGINSPEELLKMELFRLF